MKLNILFLFLPPPTFPSSSISCPTFLSSLPTSFSFFPPPHFSSPSPLPSPLLLLPSSFPLHPTSTLFPPQPLPCRPLESLVSDLSEVARLTSPPAVAKMSGNMSLEEELQQTKGDWSCIRNSGHLPRQTELHFQWRPDVVLSTERSSVGGTTYILFSVLLLFTSMDKIILQPVLGGKFAM